MMAIPQAGLSALNGEESVLDQRDFAKSIEEYIPRLYRSIMSMVRNSADAEDIIQDTVMRAYANIGRYDSERPFYPWLLTIGRNLARNHLVKRNRRESDSELPIDIPEISASDPEAALIRDEQVRQLHAALEELKPEHREILELQHFQDCSYQEISEILDIPKGTVMSRLYYARKQLQTALEKYDE
jgi:RNA polymerase sigma-70 factor (ECF subfamily)